MIVISRSFVLGVAEASAGINGDNPIFGYHNLVTTSNISATTEAAGYPIDNVANPNTAIEWRANTTATHYLTVDTQAYAGEIDYIAIARHNLGSNAIEVSVEVATTTSGGAPSGWTEVVSGVLFADDAPALFRFTSGSYTGVRLKMLTGAAAARIAVVYCGKLLIGQRRIYVGHTPITDGRTTKIINGMSESGNFLGRIVLGEFNETSIAMKSLTPSWVRSYLRPFIQETREIPFFFGWRPQSYPYEVGYVWHTSDAKPTNSMSNGMMEVSMSIAGIVE